MTARDPWQQRRRPALPLSLTSRTRFVHHAVSHSGWTLPPLRIAVLADLHACAPWTTLDRLSGIVQRTNATRPDIVILAGDLLASLRMPARHYSADRIVAAVMHLRAPLGLWSIMGNHDWWDCRLSHATAFQENSVAQAHDRVGLPLLRNRSESVVHGPGHFWLIGVDSRMARKPVYQPGFDDYATAVGHVTDDAPAILLAHEPDIFAEGHDRALLQISGHTHGGQISLFGKRPVVPSDHGARYAYGHIQEGGRHLIVSGGIGYSGVPLRLNQPPEITLITLSGR